MGEPYNVLFLCTGNSARSILAEVLLNAAPGGLFKAYSAGSHPEGAVHPMALEVIRTHNLPGDGLRSKSWDEFARRDSPPLHFVVTVCDNAAGEVCPIWPGRPMTAHWGIPDPAAAIGTEEQVRKAFVLVFERLQRRISLFTCLSVDKLDRMVLRERLHDIGNTRD